MCKTDVKSESTNIFNIGGVGYGLEDKKFQIPFAELIFATTITDWLKILRVTSWKRHGWMPRH